MGNTQTVVLTPAEKIELMQLAETIATKEDVAAFTKRHGLPDELDESDSESPPTHMEITLHIYGQPLASLMDK